MGPLTILQMYSERMNTGLGWASFLAVLMAANLMINPSDLSPRMRTITQYGGGALTLIILFGMIVIQLAG